MKSTLIRSLVIFAAGAGSATVIAGLIPGEEITQGQFLDLSTGLLAGVEKLGGYVGEAKDGRVGIYSNTVGACILPPLPPKWPARAVDPNSLELGLAALHELNNGHLAREPHPVYVIDKCRPYPKGEG